jgi:outer membrane protein assembly factor BamB
VLYTRTVSTGVLMAVRASDGTTRWSTAIGLPGGLGPTTDGRCVYAPVANGLAAFDAASGRGVWTHRTGARTLDATIADGVVYSATITGVTFALDATSGSLLWSANDAGQPRRAPAIVDGTVYVNGKRLVAYQLQGSFQ